jgi:hypothetical protein
VWTGEPISDKEQNIFLKFCVKLVSCSSKAIKKLVSGKLVKKTYIDLATDSDEAMVFYMIEYCDKPIKTPETLPLLGVKKLPKTRLSGAKRVESINYYYKMKEQIKKIRQDATEDVKKEINQLIWNSYNSTTPKKPIPVRSGKRGQRVVYSQTQNQEIIDMTTSNPFLSIMSDAVVDNAAV